MFIQPFSDSGARNAFTNNDFDSMTQQSHSITIGKTIENRHPRKHNFTILAHGVEWKQYEQENQMFP